MEIKKIVALLLTVIPRRGYYGTNGGGFYPGRKFFLNMDGGAGGPKNGQKNSRHVAGERSFNNQFVHVQ